MQKQQQNTKLKTIAEAVKSAEENEKLLISIQKKQPVDKKSPSSINNP